MKKTKKTPPVEVSEDEEDDEEADEEEEEEEEEEENDGNRDEEEITENGNGDENNEETDGRGKNISKIPKKISSAVKGVKHLKGSLFPTPGTRKKLKTPISSKTVAASKKNVEKKDAEVKNSVILPDPNKQQTRKRPATVSPYSPLKKLKKDIMHLVNQL